MGPFDFICVAISLILGLGITYLLSSAVQMFRFRDVVAVDWVALGWAAVVLFWQLQYWWAIFELSRIITTWTILSFAVLVALALLLFAAGALILPSEGGQRANGAFGRDGRWALIILSAYFALSVAGNTALFGTPVFSRVQALVVSLMIIPPLFLLLKSRRFQLATIAGYMAWGVWVAAVIAPTKY